MDFLQTSLLIASVALLIELAFGYPACLLKRIGHPVAWIGKLIGRLDERWNLPAYSGTKRRILGLAALFLVIFITGLTAGALTVILRTVPLGWVIEALLASCLLAQKELGERVAMVADGLDESVEQGREAVCHIVGRDYRQLGYPAVAKAAIESLAENSSDGIVAPAFWLIVGGLPGAAMYKAINTCDSMIGYMNERHGDFGLASARLDDLVNLFPARLTGVLYCAATLILDPRRAALAWKTMVKDASGHRSPNAGWPEAAVAGALEISLGGPRSYGGVVTDLPWMGDGRRDITTSDIRRALSLYKLMIGGNILLIVLACMIWALI